jgi:hypothetical protein
LIRKLYNKKYKKATSAVGTYPMNVGEHMLINLPSVVTQRIKRIIKRMELYKDLTAVVSQMQKFSILPTTESDLVSRIVSETILTTQRAQKAVELAIKKEFIEQDTNGDYRCTVYGSQYAKRGLIGRLDLFVGSYNTHPSLIATLALIVSVAAVVIMYVKG